MKIRQKKPVVDYKKKTIVRYTELPDWLDGNLSDIIGEVQKLITIYGCDAEVEYVWSSVEDCSCYITHISEETDEELNSRVESEEYDLKVWEDWRAMMDKKDRDKLTAKVMEYEKLKKELQDCGAI